MTPGDEASERAQSAPSFVQISKLRTEGALSAPGVNDRGESPRTSAAVRGSGWKPAPPTRFQANLAGLAASACRAFSSGAYVCMRHPDYSLPHGLPSPLENACSHLKSELAEWQVF